MTGRVLASIRRSWLLCLAAIAIGLLGGIAGVVWREPPAVVAQDLHEVDRVTVRGRLLRLHVQFQKNADCQSEVHRFLWQWTGNPGHSDRRWVPMPQAPAPPSAFGWNSFEIDLPLPDKIDPGLWYYRGEVRRNCSLLGRIGIIGPLFTNPPHDTVDLPVPVVDPAKEAPAAPAVMLPPEPRP